MSDRNRPKMQNIPVRTETGKKIREAFVDNHGRPIVALDFNQVELRVMKSLADEFRLKYPEASLGMTDEEIIKEATRAPARSVQAFTKVAKDSKSTGRRPKEESFLVLYGKRGRPNPDAPMPQFYFDTEGTTKKRSK
jgi:DNA polymerase-1